jgi:hypothetical protein
VEAIKIIEKTSDASEDMVVDASQPVLNVCCQSKDILCDKKVDFVAFIATVINCTAQVSKRSKKLDIIVAEKLLGLKDFTSEDLRGYCRWKTRPPRFPLNLCRDQIWFIF